MTEITYTKDAFIMTCRGHAGAGDLGNDLICCAVSTLAETLAAALAEKSIHRAIEFDEDSGLIFVQAFPEKGKAQETENIFDTVAAGLAGIARENPEYVRFRNRSI